MNRLTINRVALGSLSRRRGQYKAMIIGAGLAIFFVSSLFLAMQSVYETYRLAHVARNGSQDAIMRDTGNTSFDILREGITPEALLETGLVTHVGGVFVIGETDEGKCPIGYYDEQGAEMAGRTLLEGRLPNELGEIAVEPDFLHAMRINAKPGDVIELSLMIPIGVRTEFLPEPIKKTYQIVGILKPMSPHLGGNMFSDWEYLHYPSAIVSDKELVEPGGRTIVHRMVKLARGVDIERFNDYISETFHLDNTTPTYFSLFGGPYSNDKSTGQIMVIIAGMLGVVLVLSACLGIVNAFSSSLTQRRTQIGMMRAVGATSRQIRSIFGREAFLLAVLIAPVSIALSYLFVWALTRWIGLVSFHWSPWFLPVDIAASLLCVVLAAWIPLLSASRIPPMQAIRDVSLLRTRKRVRLRQRQTFDAPRLIARRFLLLYRTRQAGIAVMVSLSMLMITAAVPFVAGMLSEPAVYGYQISGYRWPQDSFVEQNVSPHAGMTDADVAEILALPMVSGADISAYAQISLQLDAVTPYAAQMGSIDFWMDTPMEDVERDNLDYYRDFRAQLKLTQEALPTGLWSFEGSILSSLEPYVLAGKIDIAALNEGREVLMCAPNQYYRYETRTTDGHAFMLTDGKPPKGGQDYQTYTNDAFHEGDVLHILRLYTRGTVGRSENDMRDFITGIEREDATTTIGAILSDDALYALSEFGFWSADIGALFTTNSGMAALGIESAGYIGVSIKLSGTPDDATHSYLNDQLLGIAARGSEMGFINNVQSERDSSFWQGIFKASLLAVALLLMSMCVSLVSSAITGRIRSDKRSIGTLRAVGAQLSDVVRSYRLQTLAMVLWGVIGGLALGFAYALINSVFPSVFPDYMLPHAHLGKILLAQAAFLGAVALLCGINLSLRVREITRDSIVANIREL